MSTIKTNKIQTLGGFTYNVPVQVVTSSLGAADLGTTATSTSDRTASTNNPAWVIATSTTTWTNTSTLSLTISPKFANSIIRLDLSIFAYSSGNYSCPVGVRIIRGSTIVWRPAFNTLGPYGMGFLNNSLGAFQHHITAIDSPATTSAITYSLQYRTYTGSQCHLFGYGSASDWASSNYLIATEIAQ